MKKELTKTEKRVFEIMKEQPKINVEQLAYEYFKAHSLPKDYLIAATTNELRSWAFNAFLEGDLKIETISRCARAVRTFYPELFNKKKRLAKADQFKEHYQSPSNPAQGNLL